MIIKAEQHKHHFKNHKAKLQDFGNIKVLDFKNPDSSHYRIRFIFEEDYYRLHISGDLGHLIASNYKNMTFEGFKRDYAYNPEYLEGKVDCCDRELKVYDSDKAREEIKELIYKYGDMESLIEENAADDEEDMLDDIMYDFDDQKGIGRRGYDILDNNVDDFFERCTGIGLERSGMIELYCYAFNLAIKQLEERS